MSAPDEPLTFVHMVTERGFAKLRFFDLYDAPCSIQKSSIATVSAIWIGGDGERMHLTREQVRSLLPILNTFVNTGELPPQ